jgi:hypothetical protein
MSIPSYGDYVRKGSGGPEGTCLVCHYEGPMDHGLTGYMCAKCKTMKVKLKLKDNRLYHQMGGVMESANP